MAKTFKAMWLGDADAGAQVIEIGGVTFVKGQSVDVPEDLTVNGIAYADVIKNNPVFAIDGEKADVVDDQEEEEIAAAKADLDARGITYRSNASLDSLRKLLADG